MDPGETTTAEIASFIHNDLPNHIEKDQKNLYITSEGDLQSAVYYHIRNFLKKSNKIARRWFVQNKLTTESKSLVSDRRSSEGFANLPWTISGRRIAPVPVQYSFGAIQRRPSKTS